MMRAVSCSRCTKVPIISTAIPTAISAKASSLCPSGCFTQSLARYKLRFGPACNMPRQRLLQANAYASSKFPLSALIKKNFPEFMDSSSSTPDSQLLHSMQCIVARTARSCAAFPFQPFPIPLSQSAKFTIACL